MSSAKRQSYVSKIFNSRKSASSPPSRKSKQASIAGRKSQRKSNKRTATSLLSSSSSSISSIYAYSVLHLLEEEVNESQSPDILEDLYDTDNESSQEDEPEYQQRLSLGSTTDFFQDFGTIPEIDDIIPDISDHTITAKQVVEKNKSLDKDVGRFVHPLTGDVLHSPKSAAELLDNKLSPLSVQSSQTFAKAEEFDEDVNEMSEIDLELDLPEDTYEDDVDLTKLMDEDKTFETFLEMEGLKERCTYQDISREVASKMEEEAKQLRQHTMDIVNDLICKAVEVSEYIRPDDKLRQNLDKHKLMLDMLKKTQEFHVENRIRHFLNQKIVEFYRRKKSFRSIRPDSLKTVELEKRKYSQAVERLDQILAKESNVTAMTLKKTQELENELNEAKIKGRAEIENFEEFFKKNLMRDNRPKCNVLIEKLLAEMSKCRQEVSAVRFEMLLKQHAEAELMEKLAKIDDLGNGLTMKNFDNLQTETQALDKKIEERNAELSKLYIRVRRDIHLLAHYKERQKMLRNSVMAQRMALEELMEEKQAWRSKIYQLTVERNRIRQQINELSFDGGLLDKPALMFDYDQTCQMVEEHRAVVSGLRETLQGLQEKIDTITKRWLCNRLSIM